MNACSMPLPTTGNLRAVRPTTLSKYQAIQRRYHQLYHVERLRIDDVMTRLCAEFYMVESRIQLVLKLDLSD